MKKIFISQRVDIHPDYGERRDAIDQMWAKLIFELGFCCVPIPNHPEIAKEMLKDIPPYGILLSGGNTPQQYGGNAPERDATDNVLIGYAVSNNTPLLGVCRGMQSIVLYFGGSLKKTENHIAVRHTLNNGFDVNSFHAYSPHELTNDIIPVACSQDGEIEYIKHKILPITGIMWHPERETPFKENDILLMKSIFLGDNK